MIMEKEYNEAYELLQQLSKMNCATSQEWIDTVSNMFALAMAMHNIVNLERAYLMRENEVL